MPSEAFTEISAGLQDALDYVEGKDNGVVVHHVVPLNVAEIRGALRLSQGEFAEKFGFSVATVRNWEQGRRAPRGPARSLLRVIQQEPEAVIRALTAV